MKTPLLAAMLILVALAGCTDTLDDRSDNGTDGPAPDGTGPVDDDQGPAQDADPPDVADDAPPLALSLQQTTITTRNATIAIGGTTNVPALITMSSDPGRDVPDRFEANGSWQIDVAVDHGHTTLHVRADDGRTVQQANASVVRLSEVTVQVTYRGDVGLDDRDDTFWMDIDRMRSNETGDYDGCSQEHPGHANVHDAMLAWTAATGHEVTYSECGDFGVGVEAIEGHESPGFWCYEVNGEAAEQGISLQPLAPGDVVAWDDCTLVLG